MSRNLIIAIVFLCGYALAAETAEQPKTLSNSEQIALEELRRAAFADWKQGKYAEASDRYQEILRLSADSREPDELLAGDLHSLGIIYSEMGRYSESATYYQRELEALGGGTNQVAVGLAYTSLAGIQQIQGSFLKAEECYKNAIEALRRSVGPKDSRTAQALNGLGWLYTLWGKTEEAGQFLQKARNAAESAMTPDNPSLIRFLDAEASYLATVGRYSEAEREWKRAVEIGENAYPGDDSEYNEVFLHLGQAYAILQQYPSAEEMFQRFLASEQRTTSPGALVRAVVGAELGRVYTDQHKYAAAEPLFLQSLKVVECERDKVPLSYALVQGYLGDYYMERSKWQDAEVQYRSALTMRIAVLGENAPDVAATLIGLSKALRKLHRKKEADAYMAQASSIIAFQKNPAYTKETIDVRTFRQK